MGYISSYKCRWLIPADAKDLEYSSISIWNMDIRLEHACLRDVSSYQRTLAKMYVLEAGTAPRCTSARQPGWLP